MFVRDKIVKHWAFDASVLVLIIFNCITLAMDNPLDPSGTTKAKFLDVTDKVSQPFALVALHPVVLAACLPCAPGPQIFIALFGLEAALKLYGLSVPVYFRDPVRV